MSTVVSFILAWISEDRKNGEDILVYLRFARFGKKKKEKLTTFDCTECGSESFSDSSDLSSFGVHRLKIKRILHSSF